MKKVFTLICGLFILFNLTGCHHEMVVDDRTTYDDKLLTCLSNELSNVIGSEYKKEIKIDEVIGADKNKMYFYKGEVNNNNAYMMIEEINKTYHKEVVDKYENYFSSKYDIYQRYEIPGEGITIYLHTDKNDTDLKKMTKKCANTYNANGKSLSNSAKNKIDRTDKIVIKSGNKELGTISDKLIIAEIKESLNNSKQYGDAFLCDNYAFDFILYEGKNIIDTIYVWYDGGRILPKSLDSKGCNYYGTNGYDLRKVIEDNTNYKFYNILDITEVCDSALERIYQDDNYNYYFSCIKSDTVLINYTLSNKTMRLKDALNKNYVTIDEILERYPELMIKEKRS